MLMPTETGDYNFWVYMCPDNAEFSAKAAVARLRKVAADGVIPWGTVKVTDRPLIENLIAAATQSELPSEIKSVLGKIYRRNHAAGVSLKIKLAVSASAKWEYT